MEVCSLTVQVNKTHDETLYFLGGYVRELEDMSAEKFSAMLGAVDMTDPDQAAAAGSMSQKLLSADTTDPPTTTLSSPAGGGGGTPTSTSNPGELAAGLAALQDSQDSLQLGWKETEKNKQLLLLDLYNGLLSTDGVKDGALPKHIDSRSI